MIGKNNIDSENGSSLVAILILIVIVTIFIGAILSGIVIQNRFIQRDVNQTKARYAAEAGITLFLNSISYQSLERDTSLFVLTGDSTRVYLRAWPYGGFLDITSSAVVSGQKKTIRVLAGARKPEAFGNAVVLGDTTVALTLTGTTRLTGDILAGKEGVKTADFKGYPFSGSRSGDITKQSGQLLPSFNTAFIRNQSQAYSNAFESGVFGSFNSSYNGLSAVPAQQGDTLYFDEDISWTSRDSIRLPDDMTIAVNGNVTLNGNYHFGRFTKLIARDTLQIGGNITGDNLLLYAGQSLQVGGAARLSAQCLSGNDIIIRDNAYLSYPSLLYTDQEFASDLDHEIIHLRGQSVVNGTIVYPVQTNAFTSDLFRVKIDSGAVLRGGLYTRGQTELEGTVLGSVLTHQFYFYESPSSYINWLKDNEIDLTRRPENYVLPLGFSGEPEYKYLEWFEVE